MAEIELPVIVTAIANSDLESFVSGSLFTQGWSVVYRALDLSGLERYLSSDLAALANIVLVYSPDLPNVSPAAIDAWHGKLRNIIGFSANRDDASEYFGVHPIPKDVTELASVVRGSVRAPLLRSGARPLESKRRAHVITVGGASTAAGCTSLAINLAMELSVLGKSVLLLDGDFRRPSVAALLGVRKLDTGESWKVIAPNLSAGEITKERVQILDQYMEPALLEFDYVIIDLGTIEDLGYSLTDRRWGACLNHWSCDNSNEMWFLGKADILGIYRMDLLVKQFSQIAINSTVSVLMNMKAPGRKGSDQEGLFLTSIAALRPTRIYTLPRDPRSLQRAQLERCTLIEIDDRSALRKAIAKIAVELTH